MKKFLWVMAALLGVVTVGAIAYEPPEPEFFSWCEDQPNGQAKLRVAGDGSRILLPTTCAELSMKSRTD